MSKFRFVAPFNTTGYGRASVGYAKGLLANGFKDFTYHPIGDIQPHFDLIADKYGQELLANHCTKEIGEGPAFVFWHIHDLPKINSKYKVQNGRSMVFSTFEVDRLTPQEVFHLSNYRKIATANQYHTDILRRTGLPICDPIPHAAFINAADMLIENQVSVPAQFTDWTNAVKDYINELERMPTNTDNTMKLLSVGKYESRKGSRELLEALLQYEGEYDSRIILAAFWYNQFIPGGYPYDVVHELGFEPFKNKLELKVFTRENVTLILFPPAPTQDSMYSIFDWDDTDLAIFPSKAEGFNLPLIEAYDRKIPCIASRIPVHEEIAEELIFIKPDGMVPAHDSMFFHGNANWYNITPEAIDNTLYEVSENGYQITLPRKLRYTWEESAKQIIKEMSDLL